MGRSKFFHHGQEWKPRIIEIEYTEEKLTAAAGIDPLVDLFVESPQFEELKKCLPKRVSNASYETAHLALTFIAGFLRGADSLDDLERIGTDALMEAKFGSMPSARALGDYLRDFSAENLSELNTLLHKQAHSCRKKLTNNAPVIDIDSTSHVQSGEKIEGVAYNYKNEWCLDSLSAFDELGLCHALELRPGNTFSAQGAVPLIERAFKNYSFRDEKYLRADSAFCNEAVIRRCVSLGIGFSITAHGNMNWESHMTEITNWEPWKFSEDRIKENLDLPRIEIGSFVHQPSWAESLRLFVIVKRTWVEKEDLFGEGHWKYYGVITNRSLKTMQELMEFHHKRGNCENFIREEKYGYDLKHFPCLKLSANHAYGLLAMVAHNFLRTIGILENPKKPKFSRRLRYEFVHIPGHLIRHARGLTLKIPKIYAQEVSRIIQAWRSTPYPSLNTG